jgi:hypothetical protein
VYVPSPAGSLFLADWNVQLDVSVRIKVVSKTVCAVSKRQTLHYHGICTANTFQMLYFVCLIPRLWSSGQSFWIQIQRSDVRIPALPEFIREVVGLEQGPLSLVSTTEELLGRKSNGSGLEIREYGRRDPSR